MSELCPDELAYAYAYDIGLAVCEKLILREDPNFSSSFPILEYGKTLRINQVSFNKNNIQMCIKQLTKSFEHFVQIARPRFKITKNNDDFLIEVSVLTNGKEKSLPYFTPGGILRYVKQK